MNRFNTEVTEDQLGQSTWSTVDIGTGNTVAVCQDLEWARCVTRALNECAHLLPEGLE